MEELQARIKARRTLPTEQNLARQPYIPLEDEDEKVVSSEANVVEMPQRVLPLEAPVGETAKRTPAKRKAAGKSRSSSNSSKQKPLKTLYQRQEANLKPSLEELKRLETYVERINQILAARAHRTAPPEQLNPASGQTPARPQGASSSPQPPRQVSLPNVNGVQPMPNFNSEDSDRLEAQAEDLKKRISQLLEQLESEVFQGGQTDTSTPPHSFSPPPNRESKTAFPPPGLSSPGISPYTELNAPSPPSKPAAHAEGGGCPDGNRAEQEAVETAEALRYLFNRAPQTPPSTRSYEATEQVPSRPAPTLKRQRRSLLRRLLQLPAKRSDRVGDAILWVMLAATSRVATQFLVVAFPILNPIVMALMLAPAAIAVYLTVFVPNTGILPIYRLFLLMLGFLLGGKI